MIKETTDKFNYILKGESKKTTYWEKIFEKHLTNKELIQRENVKYSYKSKRKTKIN